MPKRRETSETPTPENWMEVRREFALDAGYGVLSEMRASIRPGRWWRVITPNGSLWYETSSEEEAREEMRPGDRLERWWEMHVPGRWMPELTLAEDGSTLEA